MESKPTHQTGWIHQGLRKVQRSHGSRLADIQTARLSHHSTKPPANKGFHNMPDEHAKFSPSALKHYATCPQWRNDESGDSSAADEGTMLHGVMERWAKWLRDGKEAAENAD